MADLPVPEEPLDLDLLASSLTADATDVRILLKVLVDRLASALGSRLEIQRAGGKLFKRSDDVSQVRINLGDDQLEAKVVGTGLECTVGRSSGGIRIRSARVTTEQWLRQLLGALSLEAAKSEATRQALESMMIGGQP